MDFLGIGVPEFFVILILALIIIGPQDLPKVAARLGKWVRDLRMMSEGFRAEWRRELGDVGLEDIAELKAELMSARQALQEAGQEIRQVGQSVEAEMKDAGQTVEGEVKDAHTEMNTATKDVNAELRETVSTVKTIGAPPKPGNKDESSSTPPEENQANQDKADPSITAAMTDGVTNSDSLATDETTTEMPASTANGKPMVIPGRPDTPVVHRVGDTQSKPIAELAESTDIPENKDHD